MPSHRHHLTVPHPRPATGLVLALVLGLGACASLQQPDTAAPSFEPPGAWTIAPAAGQPASLTRWWDRFGDPVLSRQVDRALQASTDLASAQANLRQARAQRALSASGLVPTLGAGGSAQSSRSEGRARSEQLRLGLDASWEPDLFGATRAGVQVAEASAGAAAAQLGATRLAVAAEAALAVLQWRGTLARRAIARASLDSQLQTLQIVRWRAEAGLVTQLDVEQARAAVEQTRAQLPALQTSLGQTLNALAVLTGRAPGSLQAELSAAEAAPQPEAPADLALAMPAEVLRQRPDVRAAEQQLAAAAARVEQADAARLPSLSLGGSIGLSALSLGALGPGAGVASLAANVNLPLFDGGRLRAQVRVQEAAAAATAAAYRAAVLGALQDVEDTLLALQGTQAQQTSQRRAAAAARAAATLAGQRYASGLVDFQNVLQTQRTLLAAEDSVATSTTALNTQHVRLYKALGGGWAPEQDEPSSP